MNKANELTVAATFNGVVLGYYEQADKLQLASIVIESGIIRRCEIRDFWNLHEMLGYLIEQPRPLGIGIPPVLALSTGRQGWRAADYWLNEAPYQTKSKYDEFPFYWGPYQMADQRSLSSIAMLFALRRRWPDLSATETNVPLCYLHAAKSVAVEPLNKQQNYQDFLTDLAKASGIQTPTREDLAKIDKHRKNKGSNDDWENPHDPDAKITKMKDGRTHLAHKAEHAVDMTSGAVLAVSLQGADPGDTTTWRQTIEETYQNLNAVRQEPELGEKIHHDTAGEIVADKGYHSNPTFALSTSDPHLRDGNQDNGG